MQETEVNEKFDTNLLGIPGYALELVSNDTKSRVGYYIRDNIKYIRRHDLEGLNSHLIIVDIKNVKTIEKRMIKIYRSFNPVNESARELFVRQLGLIKQCFTSDSVLLGDLNLDYNKKIDLHYQRESFFRMLDEKLTL